MRIYESMRRRPRTFPAQWRDLRRRADSRQVTAEDGSVWRNLVTEEKSKVAETLNEVRGNYRYNLLDENLRAFNAEVPQIWQWDDHG